MRCNEVYMSREKSVNDVEEFIFFEDIWNISFIVTSNTADWTDQSETIPTCPDSWDSFLWKMGCGVCCFPLHTCPNKGDALSKLLLNFTLDYAKRKI